MSTPLISICIPAYRAERLLPETLASLRAQTFADWELIVTEDGSRDGTERIVRDFAATVPQPVRYTRHDANRGLPATRNTGFAHATAPWIAPLDADDLWLPSHLADLLAAQAAADADLVFASSRLFDGKTGADLELRDASPEALRAPVRAVFLGEIVIQPSSALFRRSLVAERGGFDPAYPICNDLEFWLRLLSSGACLAHTGRATCRYRKHAAAMSRRSAELIAQVGAIRAHYAARSGLPHREARRAAARAYWSAARIARASTPARSLAWAARSLSLSLRSFAP